MVRADERLEKASPRITVPLLILLGTGDKATKPSASEQFYADAGSTDKTLKLDNGGYHDLVNEGLHLFTQLLQSPAPSVDDEFNLHRQFRKQVKAFRRELPAIERGSVEALHSARIASRRLRELLPLLDVRPQTRRKLMRRLRQLTRRFGAVRELDVLAMLVSDLQRNRRYAPRALLKVRAAVAESQEAARTELKIRFP